MKTALNLALAALLLAAGCSGKKEGLSFAVGGAPDELSAWEEVMADFTKETGIAVKILRQPTDSDLRRQGLVIPLKAKKAEPDVFTMDVAWIGQFAASGWLAEIEDSNAADFFSGVINTADKYRGKLIALPVNVDAGILYYRKDKIKNPPKTWAELELYSALYMGKNPGKYGYVWQGAQYEGLVCNFLEAAESAGGGIRIGPKGAKINTPENTRALVFMADTVSGSKISPQNTFTEMKEEETRQFFQRGDALFERNWPYAWALHEKQGSPVKGKTGIAPLPHFKGHKSASTLGGWHAGISVYSKNTEKAKRFLDYITSYGVQKKFALKLGWNPGRPAVYADKEVLRAMPHFADLKEVFVNAVSRPNVPYYTQASAVLQKYINSALAGSIKPKDALAAAEHEINGIIKRYEQ